MEFFVEYHFNGDLFNGYNIREDGYCFIWRRGEEYPAELCSWGYKDPKKCLQEGVEALKKGGYL